MEEICTKASPQELYFRGYMLRMAMQNSPVRSCHLSPDSGYVQNLTLSMKTIARIITCLEWPFCRLVHIVEHPCSKSAITDYYIEHLTDTDLIHCPGLLSGT